MASDLGKVFTVAAATKSGFTYKRIRHRRQTGELIQLRDGIYCTRETWQEALSDESQTHSLYVAAAGMLIGCPAWASDYSAARLYGWPVPRGEPQRVSLTVEPDLASSRVRPSGARVFAAGVPQAHRDELLGVAVLSKARTIVDIARHHGVAAGLVVADAARRRGQVYDKSLSAAVADCAGWPGISKARVVAQHAARERETPLESKSFALFIERGIPLPRCNPWLGANAGERVRVDFLWRLYRLAGEADGRVKYDDPDENDDGGALWREKLRAEAIEDMGYVLTRWTGTEVEQSPDVVMERLFRASRQANRLFGAPLLVPSPG